MLYKELCDRYFSVSGVVSKGQGRAKEVLGMATANIPITRDRTLPKLGVYLVSVEVEGMAMQGTTPGGPAERAGLKGGDVVVKLGEFKIANLDDFDGALRKFKAGDKVPVVVKRGTEEKTIEVVLDPPK